MKLIKGAFAILFAVALIGGSVVSADACNTPGGTPEQITPVVPTIQPFYPSVPLGTSAVVEGTGWNPGETVTISVEAGSTRDFVADAKGNVMGRAVLPSDGEANKTYQIIASNHKYGLEAKIAFSSIIASKTIVSLIDPTTYKTLTTSSQYIENHFVAGGQVLFQGSGYLPFEEVKLSLEGVWGAEASAITDGAGNFNLLYTFPADVNFDHLKESGYSALRVVFRAQKSGAFRKIMGIKVSNS